MSVPSYQPSRPRKPERAAVLRAIRALIRRGDRLSAETLQAFEDARNEILGRLLSGAETELSAARLRVLLSEVEPRLDRLAVDLQAKYRGVFSQTAIAEIRQAQEEVRHLLPPAVAHSLPMPPKVPDEMVQHVIEDGAKLIKVPVEELKTNIRRELTAAMINGDHVKPTAQRILAQGLTLDGMKKPVFKTAEERAEVIARTELSKAANSAHLSQYRRMAERFPTLVLRWSASMCAHMCKRCQSMHDVIVRPGESFPVGVAAPPLHPRCRCRVVSEILSEEAYRAKFGDLPEVQE